MSVTFGFFDSVNGDRKYSAEDIGRYLQGIVTSGVYADDINNLRVLAGTGMQVEVQPGRGLLEYHYINNDAPLPLALSASSTLDRIDAIVMRLIRDQRICEIAVKTGTPATTPTVPEMLRTENVKEYMLASVFVPRLSSAITQENITDTRPDPNVCGWVKGLVSQDVLSTDTTLTRPGVPADAAAAGKAIQKAAPRNLLDNSDFRNPVNQRGAGGTYGSWGGYTIDRWFISSNGATISITDNGIQLTGNLAQDSDAYEKLSGKTLTLAAKANGQVICCSGVVSYIGEWKRIASAAKNGAHIDLTTNYTNQNVLTVVLSQTADVANVVYEWVALYEGEYTVETLPEYQPKGYGAELRECRRYYRQSWHGAVEDMSASGSVPFIRAKGGANTQMAVNWHDPMRVTPTIEIYSPSTKAKGYIRDWIASADKPVGGAGYSSAYGFCLVLSNSGTTEGTDYVFHYTASADL